MVAKADQTRVKDLITETITLLCKNGLHFRSEFSIQALIGITLDKDEVFLVNIDQTIVVPDDQQTTTGKNNSLLFGMDAESDCGTYLTHRENVVKRDEKVKKPRLTDGIYYSAYGSNSAWQDRNILTSSSSKSVQETEAREKTCGISVSGLSPMSAKNNVKIGQGHPEVRHLDSDLVQNVGNMEDYTRDNDLQSAGLCLGQDVSCEIKEEPDDNMLSMQGYQDPGFLNYGVSNSIKNRLSCLIPDHTAIEMPAHHHSHLIQQELVDDNNFQVKGGSTKLGTRMGGMMSLRRRLFGGTVYHTPRNHICNLCGKAFEKKRDLRGHLAAKHEMQKEHKCDICGKEFSYKRSLTDHMFVHTRPLVMSGLH